MFRIKQKWYGGVDISAAKQKHIKDQQKERDTHRRIPRAIHRDRISMETQKKKQVEIASYGKTVRKANMHKKS